MNQHDVLSLCELTVDQFGDQCTEALVELAFAAAYLADVTPMEAAFAMLVTVGNSLGAEERHWPVVRQKIADRLEDRAHGREAA